ncbi:MULTISPECIES: M48 family metalloprotease [unclassified Duganella]|uniref:M48 family metalloprotease n=1 Tax=unclassified Duganella TaxID=2636909 RepID=UPI00088FCEC8|nr:MULTISPECIES: M48 family metalloprotease [unclassified Duganella]SDG21697.1 Putative Zn-dependent protease, contains TPR repeats [Duganella sp. OV458]SDJ26618.1 Putative Zn-dependent protease, contains TPR repeats [Duganella sp. OV510]
MRAVAAALLLAMPVAMAQNTIAPARIPNLPSLGGTESQDLSPLMERKIGEEIMRDIRRDRDYLDDGPILEYMNTFGNTLVDARPGARGEAKYDYFFFVVRDPQLNAFALPGGFIAVHSQLLLQAQNESELASVLGHEIGHVVQRHIARSIGQQKQDALIPLAAMILAALASRAGGDAAMGVFLGGQGVAIQRQLNFGREAEREADRIGLQIMGEAGFDTSGMVAFFQQMQASTKNYSDLVPAWLLTHPLPAERIADIQARIREHPYKQRSDSLDFFLVRSRARVLQDQSSNGYSESKTFFENQIKQDSWQQKTAGQYGMAFLSMKQGDTVAAQSWLDKAHETVNRPPPAGVFSAGPRSKAESIFAATSIEIKLAQPDNKAMLAKAVEEADAARQKFPLSRGIAHQYGEALLKADKLEEAGVYLRDQVQLYREDIEAYDLLAQVYSKQGKLALQHIALAESYNLQGGVMAALDQLGYARKSPDASFYDQSLIDAREREWQAARREAMGDKGKKELAESRPAFKAEMKSATDDDDRFNPYASPLDRLRKMTDPTLPSGPTVR